MTTTVSYPSCVHRSPRVEQHKPTQHSNAVNYLRVNWSWNSSRAAFGSQAQSMFKKPKRYTAYLSLSQRGRSTAKKQTSATQYLSAQGSIKARSPHSSSMTTCVPPATAAGQKVSSTSETRMAVVLPIVTSPRIQKQPKIKKRWVFSARERDW